MHYSKFLINKISDEKKKIQRGKMAINTLRNHLLSSKFRKDTTIQVGDVQNWLDNVVTELNGDW